MAALPPENTRRIWVEYFDGVNNHEVMLRGDTDTTVGELMEVAHDFFTALEPKLYVITIIGVRYAETGSTISNPEVWTGDPSYGTGAMPAINAPREIAFEGRSPDGRLVSYSMFGSSVSTPADYRFSLGEDADLDNARNVLSVAHAAGILCTISGSSAILKTYINFNFNSYWEREARG
jgi:hypothetical protein